MDSKILDILERISGATIAEEDMDLDLFEEGILDSLGFIELLVEIENDFGISIEPTSVERDEVSTPNKIINLINVRLK